MGGLRIIEQDIRVVFRMNMYHSPPMCDRREPVYLAGLYDSQGCVQFEKKGKVVQLANTLNYLRYSN